MGALRWLDAGFGMMGAENSVLNAGIGARLDGMPEPV